LSLLSWQTTSRNRPNSDETLARVCPSRRTD